MSQELLERLAEQHFGTEPEDARPQFLVRPHVIEQDEGLGRAVLGPEVTPHHEDDIDVFRLRDVGDVAAEDHQPVEPACRNCQGMNAAKPIRHGLPLRGP